MSNEKVEKVYYFMYEVREFLFKEFEYVDKNVEYIVSEAHELKSTYENLNEAGQLEVLSSIKKGLTEIFTVYINMVNGKIQDYSVDDLDVLYLNNNFLEMVELVDSMYVNKVSNLIQGLVISEDEKLLLEDIIVAAEMLYKEFDKLYLDGYQTHLVKDIYEEVETIVGNYHSYNGDVRLDASTELLTSTIRMCEEYGYSIENHDEDNELKDVLLRAYFSSCALKEILMFKHLGE